jgi:type II secretory pathway component PulF
MNYDEFAFFNQQLAAMLREGIPLEGALRQLCNEMRDGPLRTELQSLEAELAKGVPITEALNHRDLPDIYKRLIQIGVKGGNLPATLTMLADYYHRQNNLWIRLKGLMLYPLIVLFMAFVVSLLFVVIWASLGSSHDLFLVGLGEGRPLPKLTQTTLPLLQNLWIFPTLFGLLFLAALAAMFVPSLHQKLRWKLPVFKEASVSRVASGMTLLLQGGVDFPEAIHFVKQLENNRTAAADLNGWLENLERGVTRFSEIAASSRVFPPLFVWMVANGGENLSAGFKRAAELYGSRAEHRTEMALYAALPVAVMFLGIIILSQAYLLLGSFLAIIDLLNALGG